MKEIYTFANEIFYITNEKNTNSHIINILPCRLFR